MQTSSGSNHLRTGCLAILAAIVTVGTAWGATPRGMRLVQTLENLPATEVPSAAMGGSGTRGFSSQVPTSSQLGPEEDALLPSTLRDTSIDSDSIVDSGEVIVNDPAVVEPMFGQAPYGDPSAIAYESGPAPVYSSGQWLWRGTWYTRLEFLMLKLDDPNNYPLSIDSAVNQNMRLSTVGLLSIGATGFRYEPGMRITLGRLIGRDAANRDHSAEITYSGLLRWSDRGTLTAASPATVTQDDNGAPVFTPGSVNTLLNPFGPLELGFGFATVDGFSAANEEYFEYTSELNGFEASYRLRTRPGRDQLALQPNGSWVRHNNSGRLMSLLGGFRFISLSESYLYTASGEEQADPDNNPAQLQPFEGRYTVDIDNGLVGTQVGWEMIEQHTNWNWGLLAKTGGFINFSQRKSDIKTVNGIAPRSQDLDTTTLAWVGEVSLSGAYFIRPNFSIRTAYNLMYINGVSRVIDNIGLAPDFPDYHARSDAIYHGLSLGVECVW